MESFNIDELYQEAENRRLSAFEAAQQDSLSRLKSNLNSIETTYRSGVTQAQNAARISALGQEEKLAAAGLSSGSAYTAPTTGYTETSRIAADNNLRTNLNTLSAKKLQQEQNARASTNTELTQAMQDYYNGVADIRLQLAQSKIDQYNTDREYNYNVQKTAYEQAMARWETYGVVLPADAAILGVKAGTRTATSSYNNAKLALERWKATLK
ncbi:MAG: hypothetical protein Q4C40_07135 [Eubacteriales bacterium]|nr:hypothetical protein [Eubacteriales bacterium]